MEYFPTHFMRQYYPVSKTRTRQEREKEKVREWGEEGGRKKRKRKL